MCNILEICFKKIKKFDLFIKWARLSVLKKHKKVNLFYKLTQNFSFERIKKTLCFFGKF